jgi:predicted RNase H-like nuclease (RuvC/YqgF family)
MDKENAGSGLSDQQRLVGALETVTEIVLGKKLELLQTSFDALGPKLTRRFAESEKSVNELAARNRKELAAQIDEIRGEMRQANDRTEKMRAGIETNVDRLRESVDELSRRLSRTKAELQAQMETTNRLSGALANAASILSGQPASAPAPVAVSAPMTESGLDNALDQMFGNDPPVGVDRAEPGVAAKPETKKGKRND